MVCLCGWTFNKHADEEAQACIIVFLFCVSQFYSASRLYLDDCSATDLIQLLNKETIWVGNWNPVLLCHFLTVFLVVSFSCLSVGVSLLSEVSRTNDSYELILFNKSIKDRSVICLNLSNQSKPFQTWCKLLLASCPNPK